MTDLQAIADRVEIEALRGEFADAAMTRDFDRLAALFTEDGAVRIPAADAESEGRAAIRAGAQRLQGMWEYFIQHTHPGRIELAGDTATGRAYLTELGRSLDGAVFIGHGVYHDRYRRTSDGWKFAERVYEMRHAETPIPAM
ncbi:MAG TPA: nuclear transport factor 2 family protein [Micromonosporaceae bacterium]|jgi:ketosteroid isomerase-like protein